MIDSDNVLLLRLPRGACGFSLKEVKRPSASSRVERNGFIAATIYYLHAPVDSDFISYFENTIQPVLTEAGASILAYFVTEDSPNTFPRLPVREGEFAFVWFAGFSNLEMHKEHLTRLRESRLWNDEITKHLRTHLKGKPEVLRLTPTPRSRLTGNI